MKKDSISAIRQEYDLGELSEKELKDNPFDQFAVWFQQALDHQVMEPNAMVLSSITATGSPASRVVLLKDFDDKGFVFYTNYESRKGKELLSTPHAALLFFWPELQRQVRIEGAVSQISAAQSDEYFDSRPRGSRLGAWASPQSQIITERKIVDQRLKEYTLKFSNSEKIDRPPHWGGFNVSPKWMEFWQGRANRLHDRLVYERIDEHALWEIKRLAP